jgi:hypothetical protein
MMSPDELKKLLTPYILRLKNAEPLLELVAKNEDSKSKLVNLVNVKLESENKPSKLPFNKININQLLALIKPGDYHFFACRGFEQYSDPKETKKHYKLSRQLSFKKRNNSSNNQSNSNVKTSPIFKNFGGDNGKIAVLARFIELVLIELLGFFLFEKPFEDAYDESNLSFNDYIETFFRLTTIIKPGQKLTFDKIIDHNKKIYSKFVNFISDELSPGKKKISFKNDEVFIIEPQFDWCHVKI